MPLFLCLLLATLPPFALSFLHVLRPTYTRTYASNLQLTSSVEGASSLKPNININVLFNEWETAIHAAISRIETIRNISIPETFQHREGSITSSTSFTFSSQAFETTSLRYARTVKFIGTGFNVFNFIAVEAYIIS